MMFNVNGFYFTILSQDKLEVEIVQENAVSGNAVDTELTIPSYVEYDSKTYKVVEIASRAFQDCKNITKIFIPKTIRAIRARGLNAIYAKSLTIEKRKCIRRNRRCRNGMVSYKKVGSPTIS